MEFNRFSALLERFSWVFSFYYYKSRRHVPSLNFALKNLPTAQEVSHRLKRHPALPDVQCLLDF